MATSEYANWQNPLLSIIPAILGGQTNQQLDGTNKENTTGTQSSTGTTTGTTTGTNTSTTSSNADISALQKVFGQQQAGVTPEMLAAIFSEGAKKVPALQNSFANAVGARASENTPLATALTGLNSSLVNQAATLNTQMLSDSANTAAKIADLTKSQTTTGTQNTNQNTTQNTTTNSVNSSTKDYTQNTDEQKSVNTDNLKLLAGLGLGGSLLDSLLGGNGTSGGLNSLVSLLTGVNANGASGGAGNGGLLGSLGTLIKGLTGSGLAGTTGTVDSTGSTNDSNPDLNGSVGDIGTADWYDQMLKDIGINTTSLGDYTNSLSADELNSIIDGSNYSNTDMTDWFNSLGDWGWADGGLVTADKSTAQPIYQALGVGSATADQQKQQRLAAVAKLASDPQGAQLLRLAAAQQASSKKNSVAGETPAAPASAADQYLASLKGVGAGIADQPNAKWSLSTAANNPNFYANLYELVGGNKNRPGVDWKQLGYTGKGVTETSGSRDSGGDYVAPDSPWNVPDDWKKFVDDNKLGLVIGKNDQGFNLSQLTKDNKAVKGANYSYATANNDAFNITQAVVNAVIGWGAGSAVGAAGYGGTAAGAVGGATAGGLNSLANDQSILKGIITGAIGGGAGGALSGVGSSIGSSVGGTVGGSTGSAIGSILGKLGGKYVSGQLTGQVAKATNNWASGGPVKEEDADPGSPPDPEGVLDTVQGRLSIGEFVNTTPVVKKLGEDFFHHLEDRFGRETSAMQQAMGAKA